MKTRKTIKGTSVEGLIEEAYTPSNPPPYPLVLNGDFLLNTNGQTIYNSGTPYGKETANGWIMVDSSVRTGSVEVLNGGGVKLTATSNGFGFRQAFDFTGAGKTYTLTCKISAVNGNTTPLQIYLRNTDYSVSYGTINNGITAVGVFSRTYSISDTANVPLQVYIAVESTSTFTNTCEYTIDYLKLEEGSVSTAPNNLVTNATKALLADNATNATNIIPDENGAVNPNGRGDATVGDNSIALGPNATASEDNSIALGLNATASEIGAIALGPAIASGGFSIALGSGATASGVSSIALGPYSKTSESDSSTIQLGANADLSTLRCNVNLSVTSDKRDKADISEITSALAFINKLNPITFVSNDRTNYISEEGKRSENYHKYGMCDYDRTSHAAGTKKGERRRCGLLAQEVIAAMQEVYGTDNYANIVNDNFHDLPEKPSDVENKYTLAYANLVPFLIGAIKELNAEIKILKDKLSGA